MSAGDGVESTALTGMGLGARDAADALLRTLANDTVTLRVPSPPVGDSDGEELGLGSPLFTDVLLQPALVQARGAKTLVTVSAEAMEAALGVSGGPAVQDAVFASAFAVVGDQVFEVAQVERRAVFGRAYLYRLLLVMPELGGARG